MITLFGATGFTGQKIAVSLEASGLPFRLAGRSEARLAQLSELLPSHPSCLVVDARQSNTLLALFQNTRLLINCTAPFTDLGDKIVSQAAINGVHYLDISNELGFAHRIQSYDRLAKHNHSAIMPSLGFEVALSDCAAHILSSTMPGPIDSANIVYQLPASYSSSGTRRSIVRSLATSWLAYRNGGWKGEVPGNKTSKFDIHHQTTVALSMPSSESVTLPEHIKVNNINTWINIHSWQRLFAPILVPYYARLLRSILGKLILHSIPERSPRKNIDLSRSPFSILISLTKGSSTRSMTLTGLDPYQLSAKIVAYAAGKILTSDFKGSGLLPPSCAFDPQDFMDLAVATWGISIEKSFS
jgi:short subunit dehydrogenase-like uncharacterized protein